MGWGRRRTGAAAGGCTGVLLEAGDRGWWWRQRARPSPAGPEGHAQLSSGSKDLAAEAAEEAEAWEAWL